MRGRSGAASHEGQTPLLVVARAPDFGAGNVKAPETRLRANNSANMRKRSRPSRLGRTTSSGRVADSKLAQEMGSRVRCGALTRAEPKKKAQLSLGLGQGCLESRVHCRVGTVQFAPAVKYVARAPRNQSFNARIWSDRSPRRSFALLFSPARRRGNVPVTSRRSSSCERYRAFSGGCFSNHAAMDGMAGSKTPGKKFRTPARASERFSKS